MEKVVIDVSKIPQELPEILRNLGIQPAPKENEIVRVCLSDYQIQALDGIFFLARKEKDKGVITSEPTEKTK